VRREAGTLDESLAERLRRTGEEVEVPREPHGCRIGNEVAGAAAVFHLPRVGFGVMTGALLVPAVLVVIVFCFMAPHPDFAKAAEKGWVDSGEIFSLVFCAIWLAFPFFMVLKALLMAICREDVIVSTESLRVERCYGPLRSSRSIPASELEELVIGSSRRRGPFGNTTSIVARSDRRGLDFGRGLEPKELEWLHSVVKLALTAG